MSEQRQHGSAAAGLDRQFSGLPRLMGPPLCPLGGWHGTRGYGGGPVASEFTRQRTRRSLHRLGSPAEARPGGQHATDFCALHETQSSVPFPVQLLGSWCDQETGVAREP
jgi:hypothetical protein